MNTDDTLGQELRGALTHRAETLTAAPISLDDVRGTARTIQRRRRGLAVGATAAVVALLVPLGMLVDGEPKAEPDPAQEVHRVELDGTVTRGVDPAITYSQGTRLVSDGREVTVPDGLSIADRVPEGWIGMRYIGGDVTTGAVIDDEGRTVEEFEVWFGLVGSPDDSAAAWIDGSNHLMVWRDGAAADWGRLRVKGVPNPVAVVGDRVLVNTDGGPLYVAADGTTTPVPGNLGWVDSVTADGTVVGRVDANADPAKQCLTVLDAAGAEVLENCQVSGMYPGGKVSPDGDAVIATAADQYGSTYGVRVLDLSDGSLVGAVTIPVDQRRTIGYIQGATWETDDSLLLTTGLNKNDGTTVQRIYRASLESGELEQALDPIDVPPATTGEGYGFPG